MKASLIACRFYNVRSHSNVGGGERSNNPVALGLALVMLLTFGDAATPIDTTSVEWSMNSSSTAILTHGRCEVCPDSLLSRTLLNLHWPIQEALLVMHDRLFVH